MIVRGASEGVALNKDRSCSPWRLLVSAEMNRFELERICWDPKDGELCLNRLKSDESLMEDRSVCDVQIHRQIWV